MLELPHDIVEKPKAQRGRPRKYPEGFANNPRIDIRVSDGTYEKLKIASSFLGISVNELVIQLLESRAAK